MGKPSDGQRGQEVGYLDRPSDDGKRGAKANRADAPGAASSLGNFANDRDHEPKPRDAKQDH